MKMGKVNQSVWNRRIFTLVLFIIFFVYFTQVNPLVIYDGDDWVNIGTFRTPVPRMENYNPIKVLPETLFPIVGYLSVYFLKPFAGDYIQAVTVESALVLTVFIVCYGMLFGKVLRKYFDISFPQEMLLESIFLMLHFLILKKENYFSPFLFGSVNLTCIYHYILPGLLNFSVCFYLLGKEKNQLTHFHSIGWLILGIYLCIFSNILHSIILAAFVGIMGLNKVRVMVGHRQGLKNIVYNLRFEGVIILVWFISLYYEAHGNRAKDIATHNFGASFIT